MLNASAACLGTTPDDSPALSEARKRLAEASSDLAAFFAEPGRFLKVSLFVRMAQECYLYRLHMEM